MRIYEWNRFHTRQLFNSPAEFQQSYHAFLSATISPIQQLPPSQPPISKTRLTFVPNRPGPAGDKHDGREGAPLAPALPGHKHVQSISRLRAKDQAPQQPRGEEVKDDHLGVCDWGRNIYLLSAGPVDAGRMGCVNPGTSSANITLIQSQLMLHSTHIQPKGPYSCRARSIHDANFEVNHISPSIGDSNQPHLGKPWEENRCKEDQSPKVDKPRPSCDVWTWRKSAVVCGHGC